MFGNFKKYEFKMIEAIKEGKDEREELNLPLWDFLYNNGLVNIFITLCNNEYFKAHVNKINDNEVIFKNVKINFLDTGLKISGNSQEIFELYSLLRKFFYPFLFEESGESKNKKGYYDEKNDKFIVESKLAIAPRFGRLGRIDHMLPYLQVKDDKLKEIKQKFEEFKRANPKIEKESSIQHGKKKEVFVWKPPKELGENIAEKIKEIKHGKEKCVICGSNYTKYIQKNNTKENKFLIESTNLVFDFGSNNSFKDMRTQTQMPLCFMCDLVYKYGLFYNYFNIATHFIISTPLLLWNKEIKNLLPDILTNKPISENETSNFIKKTGEIFFVSGIYSQILLLLHKIYSEIIKKDPDDIGKITIYYFTATSDEITDSGVYNKTTYIAKFFEIVADKIQCLEIVADKIQCLTTAKEKRQTSSNFFGKLINYLHQKDLKKAQNVLKEEFCNRILNAQYIDDLLAEICYYNLQRGNGNLPSQGYLKNDEENKINPLYEFNKRYINLLKMDEKTKVLHDVAKETGQSHAPMLPCHTIVLHVVAKETGEKIGDFCAKADNKNILYELREIEKYEGLTEFFKNFEYEVLKVMADEAGKVLLEETKENINKLLKETSEEDIKIVRNYLAIYAIQKYIGVE